MSDNLSPQPTPPTEGGTPNTITHVSGGVNINAQGDVNIGGDVVGRDKITYTVIPRDKNLTIVLEKVKDFWIEGVLKNSVHHAALIELGKQVQSDAVEADHPWETIMRTADQPDRTLPPDHKIVDVFDEVKGALLILGEPGSGKTTTLLELARDLIARAEKDSTLPVPVVFNLSSWAEKQQKWSKKWQPQAEKPQTLAEWLVDELRAQYGVPGKLGRQWIEKNDLILLLDGLDEIKAVQRKVCGAAINTFRTEYGMTGMVIGSRTREYEELATQLKLNSAIRILPLTTEQIDCYLAAGGTKLAALGKALQADEVLQELAVAPLMLSVMSLAYSGQSIDARMSARDDPAQRRKRLFDAYVDKMFARTARTKHELYAQDETVRWLAWLAARMSEHGQTVFLIEGMQPSWLQSQIQRRIFYAGSRLVSDTISRQNGWKIKLVESLTVSQSGLVRGLVGGLVLGLILGLAFGLVLGPVGGLVLGLIGGLVFGLLVGLSFGLNVKQVETKTKPNQGIWQSGANALVVGLAVGLVFGLFVGLLAGLVGGPVVGLIAGLVFGLVGGLAVGLDLGGLAFIQHFLLRFILWRNGYVPFNYVRFLDYAAERIFLRKVGGGYIFIHRMLLEYFAELELQPNIQSEK